MTKTAYLSGPMRGLYQWGFPIFDRNAAFLRDNGWTIISPAEVDRELGFDETDEEAVFTEEDFQVAIRRDYEALTKCDSIIFLPGWENSTGAKLESDFANVLKLDRYRVDADNDYLERELIVAFCGHATVGKDAIAREFVQNDSFERVGFADSLKSILYALNPRIELQDSDYAGTWPVRTIVDRRGWDEAKKEPEIRQLLQTLGSEAGRDVLGENIWIDTLFKKPTGARVIIPDCRYFNEMISVKARGGYVIKVERPGVGPINSHISDRIDFEADLTICNDGTVKDSYLQVCEYLRAQGVEL